MCSVDRRALLQLILFVVLWLSAAKCVHSTSKPASHLIWLCKSLGNPRDRPPAVPALQRLEVPEVKAKKAEALLSNRSEQNLLFRFVFQLSEQNHFLFSSVFQFYLFV